MKKTKRLLSVIICVLLIVAALPLAASAASVVKDVALTVNVKPGVSVSNSDEYLSVDSEGTQVAELLGIDYVAAFEGGDMETGEYVDTFEMGQTYTLYIVLVAKDGYVLPESLSQLDSATVNGETASVEADFISGIFTQTGKDIDCLLVTYQVTIDGTVNSVELLVQPYGNLAIEDWNKYAELLSSGVNFESSLEAAVLAFDADGNAVTDSFETGEEYRLEIYVAPKENCHFAKDETTGEFCMGSVKLNGEEADYEIVSYDSHGYREYIKIVTVMTALEPKYIENIAVTVSELEGLSVYDYEKYITVSTPGLAYSDEYPTFATGYLDAFSDTYVSGDVYTLFINLVPAEGYFFPADGVISVSVDGAEYVDYYIYENDDGTAYVEIMAEADLVGDGIIDRIVYFFKCLFYEILGSVFGFVLF